MNILEIIEKESRLIFSKKSNIHGGEYAGPCPFCGGTDRFSIHPSKDHFVCRQCQKAGDAIHFTMEYLNKSYTEVCNHLDISPNYKFSQLDPARDDSISWEPKEIKIPSKIWQEKAKCFLFEKFKYLMSPSGKNQRDYLNNRGIKNETIKRARMGYSDRSVVFDAKTWGITSDGHDNSTERNIWVPEGILIPQFYDGNLMRIRVRQSNPISLTRYAVVRGSSMGFFDYEAHIDIPVNYGIPWIVVESDLDGWLLHQECGDLIRVFSAGSSSARPDTFTHECLKEDPGLICLDNDKAGCKETEWWSKQYLKSIPWMPDGKKDPGEIFEAGTSIREWIKSGLDTLCELYPDILDTEKSNQEKPEGFKERIAKKHIQTNGVQLNNNKIKKNKESIKNKSLVECVHGQFCIHLSNSNMKCMVNKKFPFLEMVCPKKKWWRNDIGNGITQIILGIGL